tara:strand:+ start:78 stop:317 length:240 start_codon:yes stop_codon:yes gene_type:complete
MRYVLFAKESCDFCTKAVELLASQDQDFRVINFEEDQESILKEVKDAYGWKTVPMIFQVVPGESTSFVGGYTDLVKLFE